MRLPRPALAAMLAVASLLTVGAAAAPSVLAAPPDFRVVSDTTYEARPAQGLIHVTVDGRGTSYKADTSSQHYYYTNVVVVVAGGATNLTATAAGLPAAVTVLEQDEHQVALRISLNRSVFYQQTGTFELEFDLPSGAAGGDARVGANVAAFPIWAVGTPETPGSTVTVSLPPDFQIDVTGEPIPEAAPRGDGGHLYTWGPLPDPIDFFPYVVADNPVVTEGTFTAVPSTVQVGDRQVKVTVRAWADDAAWGQRVSDRITAGLPVLSGLIGLPYIASSQLTVTETVPRTIGGYAGIFDTGAAHDEIEISYDADSGVTLHEAAHAWFNNQLASDRWILEGFASYYAELAARKLNVDGTQLELTPDLASAAFPLSEWGAIGAAERNAELYAYGASLQVARDLGTRAGVAGLAAVWVDMHNHRAAYQPPDAVGTEAFAGRSDWRYLLDLLEERTPESYRDIFEKWVVPADETTLLDDRGAARVAYHALLDAAGAWELPRDLRRDMNTWSFGSATELMKAATALLGRRDALEARATELGLTLPGSMRDAFEAGSFGSASQIADDLDAALTAYQEASQANDGTDPLEWVGLLGADPDAELAAAGRSLADGDITTATAEAASARDAWRAAREVGTQRSLVAGGGLVLLAGGGAGTLVVIRRRRRSARLAGDAGDVADPLDE
jgi:hypothetical protein